MSTLYYNTAEWAEKSKEIIKRDNYTCALCGKNFKEQYSKLVVHHKTYKHMRNKHPWEVPDEDLVTLCRDCHKMLHAEQKTEKISTNSESDYKKLRLQALENLCREDIRIIKHRNDFYDINSFNILFHMKYSKMSYERALEVSGYGGTQLKDTPLLRFITIFRLITSVIKDLTK